MANKNRLIYADVAKEMITSHANEFSDVLSRREKALLIGGGTSCIDKCPTVDAVEVVRCKECKKGNTTTVHLHECVRCRPMERCMELDGYCSLGERRTQNEIK